MGPQGPSRLVLGSAQSALVPWPLASGRPIYKKAIFCQIGKFTIFRFFTTFLRLDFKAILEVLRLFSLVLAGAQSALVP